MRSMGTPRVNGWIPESTQINWCLAGRRHISCHCETSAHTGRGNPPVEGNQVTISAKNCGDSQLYRYFSIHFPSTRGDCHDQSADWFAMTGYLKAKPLNNNLPLCRNAPIFQKKYRGGQTAPVFWLANYSASPDSSSRARMDREIRLFSASTSVIFTRTT